jgi:hypothetical protein
VPSADIVEYTSWGFRLSIEPDRLTVTRDLRTYDARTRKKRKLLLLLCLLWVCFSLYAMVQSFVHSSRGSVTHGAIGFDWIGLLLCALLPIGWTTQALYPQSRDIVCTRSSILVTQKLWLRGVRTRCFAREYVSRLQFVQPDLPWFDTPSYLGFRAAGKPCACLPGLKCIEAQRVLDELERLGYDTLRNPHMSVMIQME